MPRWSSVVVRVGGASELPDLDKPLTGKMSEGHVQAHADVLHRNVRITHSALLGQIREWLDFLAQHPELYRAARAERYSLSREIDAALQ